MVNAARVSFHKEVDTMSPGDEKLVKYLAHHPQARFRIKMPIFVAREWYRHQIGFARNEVSRRYVDSEPEMYLPTSVRERDANLKQGSKATEVPLNDQAHAKLRRRTNSPEAYRKLLLLNVAPEVARTILPQGMYTEFIETGSLAAYSRLCALRLDPSAQWEIRQYAAAVSSLMEEAFPTSWKALQPQPEPASLLRVPSAESVHAAVNGC